MLKHIRNVPWEMGDIIPDYVLGATTCALFLRYGPDSNNVFYSDQTMSQVLHRE